MNASRAEGSSSSSIPIPPQWVYDVFVSFRGADTRKNFTSHLFAALKANGFRTFSDDEELKRGEFINDGLLKAIEGSKMSLIVFSKDYAGSRWCLDELVKIMDCRETFKQIVVPIFFDVVPSDVRKLTGVVQDAFANLKKRLREEPYGKVEKWRAALIDAATLSGHDLLNEANGHSDALVSKCRRGAITRTWHALGANPLFPDPDRLSHYGGTLHSASFSYGFGEIMMRQTLPFAQLFPDFLYKSGSDGARQSLCRTNCVSSATSRLSCQLMARQSHAGPNSCDGNPDQRYPRGLSATGSAMTPPRSPCPAEPDHFVRRILDYSRDRCGHRRGASAVPFPQRDRHCPSPNYHVTLSTSQGAKGSVVYHRTIYHRTICPNGTWST